MWYQRAREKGGKAALFGLGFSLFFPLCFLRSLTVALGGFLFVFLGFFCFCFFWGGGLPLSKHIPGSCFSGKSLRAPSHPSNPSLSLPQHLILCPYHSTLLSLHPSPSKWGLGWRLWRCGRVKRWKNRKKLRLGFVFNCSVAAISLSLSLLEA